MPSAKQLRSWSKNAKLIKKLNKYAFVKGLNPKQTEKQILKKWLGMK